MSDLLIKNGFQYTQGGVRYGNGSNGTQKIDLVKNYRHVNENKTWQPAYLFWEWMVVTMRTAVVWIHIFENQQATQGNFENARRIVNGSDKKKLFDNDNAQIIAKVLRAGNAWANVYSSK